MQRVARPVTGRSHTWVKPRAIGYYNLGDYDSCLECGVVKNTNNAVGLTCRGRVEITLRNVTPVGGEELDSADRETWAAVWAEPETGGEG